MYTRKLKKWRFKLFKKDLLRYAHGHPLSNIYDVDLRINGERYVIEVQPDEDNKVVVLQGLAVRNEGETNSYVLIEEPRLLSALLEIALHQGIRPYKGGVLL